MQINSFGDSFLYGVDLPGWENYWSDMVWPALIAQKMGLDYYCYARAGKGNQHILKQILEAVKINGSNVFYAINWTWIDRFDYAQSIENGYRKWNTVRPSLDNFKVDDFYYRNLHNEVTDKLMTLNCIYTAKNILDQNNCKYCMTYMDYLTLDNRWNAPAYIQVLQDAVTPSLKLFDSKNFVDWTKSNSFPISKTLHPLELAHQKAAEYWLPTYTHLINTHTKEDYLHAFK